MRYLENSSDPRLPGAHTVSAPYVAVPFPPGNEAEPQPQLGDFLRVLRKRRRLIVSFTGGAVLLMLIACLLTQRRYTATAVLHIENQPPQVTTNIQQVVGVPSYFEGIEFFQDQVKTLESRALAASTIRALNLVDDERFNGRKESPGLLDRLLWTLLGLFSRAQSAVDRLLHGNPVAPAGETQSDPGASDVPSGLIGKYLGSLEVTPITNTRLIRVSFTSPSPALAQKVANTHVEEYIRRMLQSKFELTGEARQFLEKEVHRVEGELAAAEQALNDFRRQHNVVSLDDRENAIVARMTDLSTRLTEAEAARIAAEADYRLIKDRDYESLPVVIQNALIATLKNEVSRLEIRQAELSQTFLSGNPQLQEVNSQLRQARARLDREIARVVGGIESVFLSAKANEDGLRAEFQQQQDSVLNLKEVSGQYIKLEQSVTANRDLYKTLLVRLQETDVVKGVQLSNASVMDRAELPTGPSEPRVLFNLAFALLFGLALGVTLSFVLDHLDSSLKTPEDVRTVLRLPTLGVVPHFSYEPPMPGQSWPLRLAGRSPKPNGGLPARGGNVRMVSHRSLHAEAYRGLRTSLLFCNPESPLRTVLITSSQAGEGKTSTTVNLAISLTQLGNRVLIVDADLRQPMCHTSLGIPADIGLAEVLRGRANLDDVIQRLDWQKGQVVSASTPPPDGYVFLDILQSGGPAGDAAELLASPRMLGIVQSLTDRYDFVLIDSPPIFPVTDSTILATVVDGVVLVVRGQQTEREITREALERLRFMNARIAGVVLNGVDPDSSEYHRYSYYFGSERVA